MIDYTLEKTSVSGEKQLHKFSDDFFWPMSLELEIFKVIKLHVKIWLMPNFYAIILTCYHLYHKYNSFMNTLAMKVYAPVCFRLSQSLFGPFFLSNHIFIYCLTVILNIWHRLSHNVSEPDLYRPDAASIGPIHVRFWHIVVFYWMSRH